MHVQAKSAPALSPPDLIAFLKVLAGDGSQGSAINVEGVTGCSVEDGGEFVFTVTHGREQEAHERLSAEGYVVQWTKDLYAEMIPPEGQQTGPDDLNQPGVLMGILERAKDSQLAGGRAIDTVLVGAFSDDPGRFFCQCTWIGAEWLSEPPADDDR